VDRVTDPPVGAEQAHLLIQARSGDHDAFRQLWRSAESAALGVCVHLTRNRADALDALQDTQLAAWRYLDRFEGRAPFSAWVNAIARNAALAVVRRQAAARPVSLDAVGDLADDQPLFSDVVTDLIDLRSALDTLAPKHREALLLWAGGLTYEQVAGTLGAPVNTVKVWIHRARQGVRARLQE
jgi:RNA polymerase sigma-70 factor (ECF subfamily)